ncbi:MAG: family 16 glycosylhydrolase [Lachnospiraceae bacterium]|nr:family 16 glycosylhydrolase [Lachnospiraceae bacterium]
MIKNVKRQTALFLCGAMTVGLMSGCAKTDTKTTTTAGGETKATEATEATEVTTTAPEQTTQSAVVDGITPPAGYSLVWHDEFDGTELSEADWNREAHEVGWVNNELQEYIPSADYAFVKDGELVIQPVKVENSDGTVSYYSGRVNTQNKHDIKYGYIEAKIKFPQGKGFLPAFWMMPQDESYYGQWPKCGEIDIAEVLGDSLMTNYGTIHYGEPHKQNQGTYTLTQGDFANEYHTFAIEWEPGSIKWFVDGEQYYETNDWYSKTADGEERTYPAPFDQPYHVILNVAVGGNWPGNPDETTVFDDRAAMKVDYVRMFQKAEYDEDVTKPVITLDMKEADETGNFLNNGAFTEAEDLADDVDWKFMAQNGGKGEAVIENGEIVITTEDCGTEEYSIQLVQPGMPMEKGCTYKFSFEAYAEEDRQMKAAVTAPNVNWIRYFPDTAVDLTGEYTLYEFTFEMKDNSDDKGRVEFNMGKQNSTSTIHIKNVRLEKVE